MPRSCTLPSHPSEAVSFFHEILNRPDETLVLILGSDEVALNAREVVEAVIAENDSLFRYVNFVSVENPSLIVEELKNLMNDGVDIEDIDNFVFISISPYKNIISEAVTRTRFQLGRGSLTTAVLAAISNR